MSLDKQKIEDETEGKEKGNDTTLNQTYETEAQVRKALKDIKSQLSNTKGALRSTKEELEETKRKLREKEKANKDLSMQIIDLTQKFQQYSDQIDKLEERVEGYSSSSEEAKSEVARLQTKLSETKDRLDRAFNTIREKNETIEQLQSQLTQSSKPTIDTIKPTVQRETIEESKTEVSKRAPTIRQEIGQSKPEGLNPPPSQASSPAQSKQSVEKDEKLKDRVYCPSCGAFGKDIRVMDDKSNVLYYQGQTRIYGKKRICKKCGTEF